MISAWENAIAAMPGGAYEAALGRAVANDGSADCGTRWLLSFASDFLRQKGYPADSPWAAFDMFVYDFEAMERIWPAFEASAVGQPIPAAHILPPLARFMAERMPVVWSGDHGRDIPPITLATSMADRIDTLVGMFAAGLKPNGSKDPYALRRAAKEVLQCQCFPVRRLT